MKPVYNLKALEDILNDFHQVTQLSVNLYNQNFDLLVTAVRPSPFCRVFQDAARKRGIKKPCDRYCGCKVSSEKNGRDVTPTLFSCPMGLWGVAVPIKKEKLASVLHKAVEKLSAKSKTVLVTAEGETLRLPVEDILYVEAFLHYVVIHTETREYRMKDSIAAFAEKLGPNFFRIHRSYLVNLRWISRLTRAEVVLDDGRSLPLSRRLADEVRRRFIAYYRGDADAPV